MSLSLVIMGISLSSNLYSVVSLCRDVECASRQEPHVEQYPVYLDQVQGQGGGGSPRKHDTLNCAARRLLEKERRKMASYHLGFVLGEAQSIERKPASHRLGLVLGEQKHIHSEI